MNKTKNEIAKETALTVDELKKMGEIIGDTRETIELYNHALNLAPAPQNIDKDTLVASYSALFALTDTMFHKNQKIMSDLNHIGYTLSENDNAFEIQDTRKQFN